MNLTHLKQRLRDLDYRTRITSRWNFHAHRNAVLNDRFNPHNCRCQCAIGAALQERWNDFQESLTLIKP